uniref:Uncharacterized protein n=1 Tax=Cajanus cajan TaxID=3821 RepID=A0A151S7K2_CAJCA|nr:hypothetical protein KK1_027357 [Cajanus cajan]KYP50802.1 hypothetical protein KK1_027367 [Cajanus cajan]
MCGAIDTTPVHLRSSPNPNTYHCRYGFPSLLLQVISDHKKIFWDVCVKAPSGMGTPAQNLFDGMLMKGRSVVVEAIALLRESRLLDIVNAVRHYSYVLRTFLWHVGS